MQGLQLGRAHLASQLNLINTIDQEEFNFLRRVALFRLRPRIAMLIDTVSREFQCPFCRETIPHPVDTLCPFPYSDLLGSKR